MDLLANKRLYFKVKT